MPEIGADLQASDVVGVSASPGAAGTLANDTLSAVADVVARVVDPDGVVVSSAAVIGTLLEEGESIVAGVGVETVLFVDRGYVAL